MLHSVPNGAGTKPLHAWYSNDSHLRRGGMELCKTARIRSRLYSRDICYQTRTTGDVSAGRAYDAELLIEGWRGRYVGAWRAAISGCLRLSHAWRAIPTSRAHPRSFL